VFFFSTVEVKRMSVSVQKEDFDVSKELASIRSQNAKVGAVVSFVGTVREIGENEVISRMELEHYPGMTEKVLENIVEQAKKRWELQGVRIIHRIGELKPMDQIVLVAVAAAHRAEAFLACEFMMDFLKVQVPIWKREFAESGSRWVSAKEGEEHLAEKWQDQRMRQEAS
jgi:molybdopterin synthase catalytic subunit